MWVDETWWLIYYHKFVGLRLHTLHILGKTSTTVTRRLHGDNQTLDCHIVCCIYWL